MRRISRILATALALGLGTLLSAPPVHADTPQPPVGGFFEIFNAFTQAPQPVPCVDDPRFSTRPGTHLIASSCHSGSNQLWQFIPEPGGYFQIANQFSGQCMELADSSGSTNSAVEQARCFDFFTEEWQARFLYFKTIPVYQFVNHEFPGKCLALGNGGSPNNGTPIVITDCNPDGVDAAQNWSLG